MTLHIKLSILENKLVQTQFTKNIEKGSLKNFTQRFSKLKPITQWACKPVGSGLLNSSGSQKFSVHLWRGKPIQLATTKFLKSSSVNEGLWLLSWSLSKKEGALLGKVNSAVITWLAKNLRLLSKSCCLANPTLGTNQGYATYFTKAPSSSLLLSFQERRQAARTTEELFYKSSVAVLGERTFKKGLYSRWQLFTNERPAKLHRTIVQWRQSSQFPIFWASQKGLWTALKSQLLGRDSPDVWKPLGVWTELLSVYSLPKCYRGWVAFYSRATDS